MRINEQMEMWIVTVVWCLDRNVRPWTWCYSNTSWTVLTQWKWNTTASLMINNGQFCIICRLKVCPVPVLHSSKTHQHSSRRTWKILFRCWLVHYVHIWHTTSPNAFREASKLFLGFSFLGGFAPQAPLHTQPKICRKEVSHKNIPPAECPPKNSIGRPPTLAPLPSIPGSATGMSCNKTIITMLSYFVSFSFTHSRKICRKEVSHKSATKIFHRPNVRRKIPLVSCKKIWLGSTSTSLKQSVQCFTFYFVTEYSNQAYKILLLLCWISGVLRMVANCIL